MRYLPGKILHYTYKPFVEFYLRKDRCYHYKDINIKVFQGVFHPGFFFSTKIFLYFLEQFNLQGKTFLELGAGTGLISIYAAKQGAAVTASDISENALRNITANEQLNHVTIQQFYSDLFQNIPLQQFDFIVINPPFYRGKINSEKDYAWYAGEHYEYFQKLFLQIGSFMHPSSGVFMIFSSDTDINHIHKLALENKIEMKNVFTKKNFIETNTVFRLTKINGN